MKIRRDFDSHVIALRHNTVRSRGQLAFAVGLYSEESGNGATKRFNLKVHFT